MWHPPQTNSGFDDYTLGEPLLTTLSEDVVSNYEYSSVPSLLLISIDSSEIAMLTELEQPFT
eukprot:scaffold13138_cov117-Alexandrium_tamarense.AAC.1